MCDSRSVAGAPIVPLRQMPYVVAGKAAPPSCEHGIWTFAGGDTKRGASKYPPRGADFRLSFPRTLFATR